MSGRRARATKIGDDEIKDLIFKLQTLLPQLHQCQNSRVPASKILKETCSYIKQLHKQVDDLSERLCQLLDSMDATGVDIEFLRNFLQQY